MFNKGGQRRTIEAPCGWRCVGHPQEVNGKFRIHKRICSTCKDGKTQLPEFSRENGDDNGWDGIVNKGCRGKGTIAKNFVSTCVIDGKQVDIRQEATSVDNAVDKIKENEAVLAEIALAIGESQKKKRKSKK